MPPYLVVKCEQVVVKRQGDRANPEILVQDLVPGTIYKIAAGHTFVEVLATEGIGRVLSPSKPQKKPPTRTYLGQPAPAFQ